MNILTIIGILLAFVAIIGDQALEGGTSVQSPADSGNKAKNRRVEVLLIMEEPMPNDPTAHIEVSPEKPSDEAITSSIPAPLQPPGLPASLPDRSPNP